MSNPQRLTLLHYLYSLAYADGHLHPNEERLLDLIARTLGIRPADRDSIAAMFAPRGDKIRRLSRAGSRPQCHR